MKLALVNMFVATFVGLLVKNPWRSAGSDTVWMYRRLWNDTVSDCWSLHLPTWRIACQNSAEAPCTQNRIEMGILRRVNQNNTGKYRPQPDFRKFNPHLASTSLRNNRRRHNSQLGTHFSKPHTMHIKTTTGLLGWLPSLIGQAQQKRSVITTEDAMKNTITRDTNFAF